MDPKLIILTRSKPFTGAQSWNQWISRFEAQTASFSDSDRLQCLVTLLEDKALDSYVSQSDTVKSSYSSVKSTLGARYGSDVGLLQAQAELAGAIQEPGESVVDFADRIRILGRTAYPNAEESDMSVQANLMSRFLCGLHDEQLQGQLCGEDSHTLQGVVDKACVLHKRRAALCAMRQATAGVRSVAAAARVAAGTGMVNQPRAETCAPAAEGGGVCPTPQPSGATVSAGTRALPRAAAARCRPSTRATRQRVPVRTSLVGSCSPPR